MNGPHGHVTPRPDGAKARCGGPALCVTCAKEQEQAALAALAAGEHTVSAATPGQAAYEAHRASFWKRHGWDGTGLLPDGQWDAMADNGQHDWEAAARAAKAGLLSQLRSTLLDLHTDAVEARIQALRLLDAAASDQ